MNHPTAKAFAAWRISKDGGASAVEYGLMMALIGAAIILTVTALGGGLNSMFTLVIGAVDPTP